ncbi:Ycf66 family protein [Spirulina subsalsa FACHB-351]|uniref:Ycf66 family protein n=1 Tax=Spirulina subsalsa FACHB-351 TaxID=234711 RepID=A0ABT3L2S3_9CYAN|nr:Ycf66 family protein [Spirulina subsalsa]MCW6035801.1 Ycf66 family protein [Spirulina subsalsa FACHB-351]
MVNFGWNSASILGLFLAVAGAGLYFLRSVRPELSRDYDIFFSAVGLACGIILLTQGWRLDPILQFGQFLLALSTVFFAFETIRLRGLATEQAKRSTPVVDEDRPVSRSYQAYREPDYDQIEAYAEERYTNPRQLRGTKDSRSSRREAYEAEPPRSRRSRPSERPSAERPSAERPSAERPSAERRSRRSSRPTPPSSERYSPTDPYTDPYSSTDSYDAWGDDYGSSEGAYSARRPRRSPTDEPPTERSRSSRSSSNRESGSRRYQDEEPAPYVDYVDYQPYDSTEDDYSESGEDRDSGEFSGYDEERDNRQEPRTGGNFDY